MSNPECLIHIRIHVLNLTNRGALGLTLCSHQTTTYISHASFKASKCRLHRVYHRRWKRTRNKTSRKFRLGKLQPRCYFHQIARILKAIVIATKRQRRLFYTCGSLPAPPRCWICDHHATDIFCYMLYSADNVVSHVHLREVRAGLTVWWVGVVFSADQTGFHNKGLKDLDKAYYSTVFRGSLIGKWKHRRKDSQIFYRLKRVSTSSGYQSSHSTLEQMLKERKPCQTWE